jgi:hypothetical protein
MLLTVLESLGRVEQTDDAIFEPSHVQIKSVFTRSFARRYMVISATTSMTVNDEGIGVVDQNAAIVTALKRDPDVPCHIVK